MVSDPGERGILMKLELNRKYPRLSSRSLLLYEMAKRRAERSNRMLDECSGNVGSNGPIGVNGCKRSGEKPSEPERIVCPHPSVSN